MLKVSFSPEIDSMTIYVGVHFSVMSLFSYYHNL